MQQVSGKDILTFRGRIVVPKHMIDVVLKEFHDHRGHFGQVRTLQMVKEKFWWSKMGSSVAAYC